MSDYKNLDLWKRAHELFLQVYIITKSFPDEERYGITSQIRRAVLSIPTNVAEGNGRLYVKEYINFLGIARGSAMEVEYLLLASKDLGLIENKTYYDLNKKCKNIIRMINSLINYLRKNGVNK